ncbi:sigma-70 family RNA polymerase sigma factor [uncultured Paludibaculum sp.]|uniref:RNA polymerase sigma factor n=1 Tax=uncultured Paludibaculum sp. TaxID=1765020 RepID=UPI002AAA8C4B|nr:sigma-70 family RNA polymerase sigma factor [uncultured Paludibaculum sp.]
MEAETQGLVEAAQRGDRAAFGSLYEHYSRMVNAVLLARVHRQETGDLVHEVFLQAWRALPSLREPAAFPGWLARIARNKALDFYRRARQEEELPLTLEGGSRPGEDGHYILAMVRSLPEAYRETLLMRLVEGLTGPEIAALTGLTHESVRVNLSRGMKMLREKLAPGSWEAGPSAERQS